MNNFPQYPTAKQVLASPVDFKISTLETIHLWKRLCLKQYRIADTNQKLELLEHLVEMLAGTYEKPVKIIKGKEYCYFTKTKVISLDSNHASILSTLHEFGHH